MGRGAGARGAAARGRRRRRRRRRRDARLRGGAPRRRRRRRAAAAPAAAERGPPPGGGGEAAAAAAAAAAARAEERDSEYETRLARHWLSTHFDRTLGGGVPLEGDAGVAFDAADMLARGFVERDAAANRHLDPLLGVAEKPPSRAVLDDETLRGQQRKDPRYMQLDAELFAAALGRAGVREERPPISLAWNERAARRTTARGGPVRNDLGSFFFCGSLVSLPGETLSRDESP